MRIQSRLAVAGKRNGIQRSSVLRNFLQSGTQCRLTILRGREHPIGYAVSIPTAFTVDTVEIAQLADSRKYIHSKRRAETSAVYRSIYYIVEMQHHSNFINVSRAGISLLLCALL